MMEVKGYLGVYASTDSFGFDRYFDRGLGAAQQKYLWFVWEPSRNTYVLQCFDTSTHENHPAFFIDEDMFSQSLVFQPSITVLPKGTARCEAVYAKYDVHADVDDFGVGAAPARVSYTEKELYEAIELDRALRSDFALALKEYKQNGKSAVFNAFDKMLVKDAIIVSHKHTFAGFGSALRKLGLLLVALKMYQQALDLSPQDPHSLCNLGRIYFELRQYKKAADCASEALKQDPTLVYAKKLLKASTKKKGSM